MGCRSPIPLQKRRENKLSSVQLPAFKRDVDEETNRKGWPKPTSDRLERGRKQRDGYEERKSVSRFLLPLRDCEIRQIPTNALTKALDGEQPLVESDLDHFVSLLRPSFLSNLSFPARPPFHPLNFITTLIIKQSRLPNLLGRDRLDDGESEGQDENDRNEEDAECG